MRIWKTYGSNGRFEGLDILGDPRIDFLPVDHPSLHVGLMSRVPQGAI